LNGILLIDKPAGPTSHDIVDFVRRRVKTRKVGHAGTLDPFATGLLVLLIGPATKISSFLLNQDKTYLATIAFGEATDTLDHTGQVTETSDRFLPERATIERLLPQFMGKFEQLPPMYSAKKVNGRPLYQLARCGQDVPRQTKPVKIFDLELCEVLEKHFTIRVTCSKGTYVRVLADSMARALGGVGHLSSLRRIRSGIFDLTQALRPEQVELAAEEGKLAEALISVEQALADYRQVTLTAEATAVLLNGKRPGIEGVEQSDPYVHGEILRFVSNYGQLLAIGRAGMDFDQASRLAGGESPFELLRVFSQTEKK